MRLREIDALECPLCKTEVEECDKCKDFPVLNDDWYCYNDGDMHFCQSCWENSLMKR